MTDLHWFSVNLPRDMAFEDVVAVVRPLAYRPRYGLGGSAAVVIEVWSFGGRVSWRLGLDQRIAHAMPAQMAAHLPGLNIQPLSGSDRPALTLAADLSVDGLVSPLRTELAGAISAGVLAALLRIGKGESAVLQWICGPSRRRQKAPEPFDLGHALSFRERRKPDPGTQQVWKDKIAEPLFACRGRVGALAATKERAFVILSSVGDALKLANNTRSGVKVGSGNSWRAAELTSATTKITWSALLNATELAALLAWPIAPTAGDDLGLIGGHISEVPVRLLIPEDDADTHPGERVLGESLHAGQAGQLVTVPVRTSLHHLHVVGPTGSGKSTLLAGLIAADIAAGHSVLVLEPKGDLVQDVLAHVPADRRDDVVVIEPDSDRPVGLSVLAGDRRDAEQRADQAVGLLTELHGGIGPRSTDLAMHAFLAISRLPDGTLCDIPILLTNPAFRRQVLAQVGDGLVIGPFFAWYNGLSEAERGQVIAPLLNKLRPFTSRDSLRRMLGQAQPRFSLEDLFTKRRVVLVNLNKGALGPETSSLLGSLLLTQLWAAIQRRSSVPPGKRHPVFVTIDEVQDYLHLPGVDLGDFFAQARGLGVALTVAHQHLGQLSADQRGAILANSRSRVVFRPATDDAKPLASSFGGDLGGADLLRLKAFEACAQLLVDSQVTRPFSVRTRPLPPWTSNPDRLRRLSRNRYGVDGAALDQALTNRWQVGGTGGGPVGVKRRGSK